MVNSRFSWLNHALAVVILISAPNPLAAQSKDVGSNRESPLARPHDDSKHRSSPVTVKRIWRVGAKIQAPSKSVKSLYLTFPIPTDWPEQHVNLYEEVIPTEVRSAKFRTVKDGVKQMVATIPKIAARKTVEIYVLMEITVSEIPAPTRTDQLTIPARPPTKTKMFLQASPLINHRKIDIKRLVKEIASDKSTAWEQIEGFYTWIGDNIKLAKGKPHGAVATLKKKTGAPEDFSNLFIAMCRAHKVPARTVWADNGEYAEFYLEDENGDGRWYPCVLVGRKEFGSMTDPRVIIQKGENIKVPEKKPRQRLVVEYITGKGSGARPKVEFVRDLLPAR